MRNYVYICLIIFIVLLFIYFTLNNYVEKFDNKKNNENNLSLVVVTPSIGRNNLIRTCNSIYKQNYKNWKHIILFDNIEDIKINKLLENIPYKPIIQKGEWKNYGNGQRHDAWDKIENNNSIITYIDDDDYYANEQVFSKIIDKFNKNKHIDVVFYPGLRYNKYFYNKPPGLSRTMSNQFAHRKYGVNNFPIRWPKVEKYNNSYVVDGEFINLLVKNNKYEYIDGDPLVIVPKSNKGI